MKKSITLLLLVIVLLFGCVSKDEFLVGDQMSKINNKYTPYISLNSLSVYEIDNNYLVVVYDNDTAQKLVEFSSKRKCNRVQGMDLMKKDDIGQFLNMDAVKLKEKLGQPHADIGSGFYIPAYITEDAYLICFEIENGVVFEVIERDLINNKIALLNYLENQ